MLDAALRLQNNLDGLPQLPDLGFCRYRWRESPQCQRGQILPTWFHATKGLPRQSWTPPAAGNAQCPARCAVGFVC